ncbi:unnamed protein product, partial [Iphiclides podalirius]
MDALVYGWLNSTLPPPSLQPPSSRLDGWNTKEVYPASEGRNKSKTAVGGGLHPSGGERPDAADDEQSGVADDIVYKYEVAKLPVMDSEQPFVSSRVGADWLGAVRTRRRDEASPGADNKGTQQVLPARVRGLGRVHTCF